MLKGAEELKLFFHKNERLDSDLSRPVPQIFDVAQILDVRIVEQFERMTKESINTGDGETALLGRRLLEDILLPQIPPIQLQKSSLYFRYQKIIAMLRFMNLSVYGMPIITKTIRENFLTALEAEIDIKDQFQFILDIYDDILLEGHIAEELGSAVLDCEEKLGNEALMGDNNKAIPQTVGNWLKLYIQFGLSGPEHKTGSLSRIQFFRANPSALKLSRYDQKILLQIFRLYDWLRYGEKIEGEEIVESGTEAKEILEPAEKQTKGRVEAVPEAQAPSQSISGWQTSQKPGRDFKPVESMNIQDILKGRGVQRTAQTRINPLGPQAKESNVGKEVSRGQTNIPSAAMRAEKPSVDIDRKLEELSKKVKKRLDNKS